MFVDLVVFDDIQKTRLGEQARQQYSFDIADFTVMG
jgi:hypothetical protein